LTITTGVRTVARGLD